MRLRADRRICDVGGMRDPSVSECRACVIDAPCTGADNDKEQEGGKKTRTMDEDRYSDENLHERA